MQRKNKISIWKYIPFLAGLAGAVFVGAPGSSGNSEAVKDNVAVSYSDQLKYTNS